MGKASQTIKVVRRYVLSDLELSSDLAIKETTRNKKYWFCLCFETVLWFLANLRDSIASASWVSVVSIVCHSAGLATKDAKRWLQLFIPNNTTSVFIQSSSISQLCLEARESKAECCSFSLARAFTLSGAPPLIFRIFLIYWHGKMRSWRVCIMNTWNDQDNAQKERRRQSF